MDNNNLSNKGYWEDIYRRRKGVMSRTSDRLFNWLDSETFDAMLDYSDYQLWEIIFKKHLPAPDNTLCAIEVGCAPGEFLVKLNKKYSYQVFGVEYAASGVELCRNIFKHNSLDENHIIHADFFSADFLQKYRNHFDVVISRGFIEHFNDYTRVVDLHASILKPGGTLIVTIPRFKGANHLLMSYFNKENLAIHNNGIMDEKEFAGAFGPGIIRQYCGYYGTINSMLFNVPAGSYKVYLLRFLVLLQYFINRASCKSVFRKLNICNSTA